MRRRGEIPSRAEAMEMKGIPDSATLLSDRVDVLRISSLSIAPLVLSAVSPCAPNVIPGERI